MQSKLERDVRFLKTYAAVSTLLLLAVLISGFRFQSKQKFEEIDVERINIVEKTGQLRMVISNRELQHPGIVDGKLIPRPNGRPPGMIFFDHKGDEAGGLIFDENGGNGHFLSLTFDKARQDQTIGIQHLEGDNGQYDAALRIWDRPNNSTADLMAKAERIRAMPASNEKDAALREFRQEDFSPERISIAKLRDKSASIVLSDAGGKPRIRMSVKESGNPKLDFLDENGKTTFSLPPAR